MKNPVYDYDVVIVGAGPAGCACALSLASTSSLNIAIIDKATFPRDKICGDALSADVVNQLIKLPIPVNDAFQKLEEKLDSHGVSFFAPDGNRLDISFQQETPGAPGYLSQRWHFDHFLLQQLEAYQNITRLQMDITQVISREDAVLLGNEQTQISTPIVVGADGAHSVIGKQLGNTKVDKRHYCAGLRAYYENVAGLHTQNYIELHFIKDILPGYFWIFPLKNNLANVGMGMLSSEISRKSVHLKEKFRDIIAHHPQVAPRFAHARQTDALKGFGLPIGSRKRTISGHRFLLTGDAASLIDPFTGEGIGNAIRSGRIAAAHIKKNFARQDFSASYNKSYDEEIYHKMWGELKLSRTLQQLLNYPGLFNFVVNKANRNTSLKTMLSHMLSNVDVKQALAKPSFYFKLFFT